VNSSPNYFSLTHFLKALMKTIFIDFTKNTLRIIGVLHRIRGFYKGVLEDFPSDRTIGYKTVNDDIPKFTFVQDSNGLTLRGRE